MKIRCYLVLYGEKLKQLFSSKTKLILQFIAHLELLDQNTVLEVLIRWIYREIWFVVYRFY